LIQGLSLLALPGLPLVEPGDDLATLIAAALERAGETLQPGDLLVIAQKIVSKAEDRYVFLDTVTPSAEAVTLAEQVDKDPRLVQLILDESVAVIRHRRGVLIVEHRLGYVHANAGIDRSNVEPVSGRERVLLLPRDPNASCAALRQALGVRLGIAPGIIINDSAGRAWRNGTVGFALGTAGITPLQNLIGRPDLFGRVLEVTEVAVADELAAAASFVMGQAAESAPVVLVRGAGLPTDDTDANVLIRAREEDLFR